MTTSRGPVQRIGVFGGAFDPPHVAHVALAQAALGQLALDELRVIPTGQASHKPQAMSAGTHRLAMAQLAFAKLPRVHVDDSELQRSGLSFTIDTLTALHTQHPQAQLYLLLGADQFAAFGQWHRWQEIVQIAIICVAKRPYFKSDINNIGLQQSDIVPGLQIHLPPLALSSSAVREKIAGKMPLLAPWQDDVPPDVARYIAQHGLYR